MQRGSPPPSFLDRRLVQRKILKRAKLAWTATHHGPLPRPPTALPGPGVTVPHAPPLLLSGCSVLSPQSPPSPRTQSHPPSTPTPPTATDTQQNQPPHPQSCHPFHAHLSFMEIPRKGRRVHLLSGFILRRDEHFKALFYPLSPLTFYCRTF